jgi:hypothetical protein
MGLVLLGRAGSAIINVRPGHISADTKAQTIAANWNAVITARKEARFLVQNFAAVKTVVRKVAIIGTAMFWITVRTRPVTTILGAVTRTIWTATILRAIAWTTFRAGTILVLLSLLILISEMMMPAEASFGSGEEGDDCQGGNNNIGKLHAGAPETVVVVSGGEVNVEAG